MSKEFHVFTVHAHSHEQAFVFEIERSDDLDMIQLCELWIVTSQNGGEVKSRINLENMLQKIGTTVGGNIDDSSVPELVNVFSEVLGDEKIDEIITDVQHKEIIKQCSNDLIFANELANIAQHDNDDIQPIVDNMLSKLSDVGKNEKN